MKIKFTGWIHAYYFAILLVVAGAVIYGSRQLLLNGDKTLSVYEATVRLDKLEEKNPLVEAKNFINFSRMEEASGILVRLGKEAQFLDSVVPLESYQDLKLHLHEFDQALMKLPSSEELSSLKRTIYKKISSLEKLASQNNWADLERTSSRLNAKIQSADFSGLNNVSRLLKSIDGDMNALAKAIEKRPILKTVNFGKEMDFLNRYIEGMKSAGSIQARADKSYNVWKAGISPEISLRKIDVQKRFDNVLWGTVALSVFILLAFGGGLGIGKMLERSIRKKFEIFTTKIVKEGIFPVERKIDVKLSQEFEAHFENLREYFHKRLGFGAMVQEAMPFPVLLLDSSLNLLWANKLFYEKWNFDNNEIPLNWDYLAQFTDLKDDNPALAALKGEVAGIYNIKVFTDATNKNRGESFEMYVRPVDYGKKKRVMVLFYPLGSLEAILADKTKDIVGPVVKTLDVFEKGGESPGFEQTMAEDFARAGIGDVVDHFHSHYRFLKGQKSELNAEVEKVEKILDEQYKLASEFKMLLKSDEEVVVQSLSAFGRFKSSLVNIIGMRERLEDAYRQSVQTAQELLKEKDHMLSGSERMVENINKNKEIFQSLLGIGSRLKEASNPQELAKTIQLLNITLSKAAMLLEQDEVPQLGHSAEQIRQAGNFFQESMKNLDAMGSDLRRADDMMIDCLKEFYTSFKGLQSNVAEMGQFVGKLDDLNKHYTTDIV